MTDLLPCPFCGAKPEIIEDRTTTWALIEHKKGCLFPTFPKHEIRPYDWEAWNTRTPEQAVAATLGSGECEMRESSEYVECKVQTFTCSACGWYGVIDDLFASSTVPNFCPNCGKAVKR